MNKQVDFYYDFGSPTAYLAWTQLPAICEQHDAELVCKPLLLGGVFKATGNDTPVRIKAKGDWMFADIARYAKAYGVPFAHNPHFIMNTLAAMRGAIWAESAGCLDVYNQALFEAAWVNRRDIGDANELSAVLTEADLDANAAAAAVQTTEIKTLLIEATSAAVERGVFGAPTMFVSGEMHFGQDRLQWVEQVLAQTSG
ncbi:MAG: 2-hydroxychromene-2-carboxylate isomerase [Gammaproteobacteria bacterium]|nr:2-hydroxychromene-2-carboxylate isomerase [Gammaproteobacteria bacterium]